MEVLFLIDFEVKSLNELKNQFETQYDTLVVQFQRRIATQEYGKGGGMLHRGFYCPSPVEEIIFGNTKRGSKTKRRPAQFEYTYSFDDSGRLIAVDHYSESRLSNREFLFYEGQTARAVAFRLNPILQEASLASATICRYSSSNKIISYLRGLCMPSEISEIYLETFLYDSVSGLLDRSSWNRLCNGFVDGSLYQYLHNENGIVTAFQRIKNVDDNTETVDWYYPIPKIKQRRI